MSAVRLQLLLKPLSRNERGRKDAIRAAEQLGLAVSGEGAATLSARCDREAFVTIFGHEPKHGASGVVQDELQVPNVLADYVSNISIAPQHVRMDD